MLIDQLNFKSVMLAISAIAVAFLYYALDHKLTYVAGCKARLTQLELIAETTAKNEAALDVREKAVAAAEAHLDSIKQ